MRNSWSPAWRMSLFLALALAAALTVLAILVTAWAAASLNGKPLFAAAMLVLPLVWAAKAGWSEGLAFALTFSYYFFVCSVTLWLLTRAK